MRARGTAAALTLAGVIATAGCTGSGGTTTQPEPESSMIVCQLTDDRGLDDDGLNAEVAAGVEEVRKALSARVITAESHRSEEYKPNLASLLAQGCDLVVGTNPTRDAQQEVLEANPEVRFLLVGGTFTGEGGAPAEPANTRAVQFQAGQGGYLAGYLAAGASTTGVVGVFGGADDPVSRLVMDGFVDGVAAYNTEHAAPAPTDPAEPTAGETPAGETPDAAPESPEAGAAPAETASPENPDQPAAVKAPVTVVGWDKATQQGTWTGSGTDRTRGFTAAKGLLDQKADVILPVGGPFGLGALDAVAQQEGARALWFGLPPKDLPEHSDVVLASIGLDVKPALLASAKGISQGEFDNKRYLGTVHDKTVQLVLNDGLEKPLPDDLVTELDDQRALVADGEVTVESQNAPAAVEDS